MKVICDYCGKEYETDYGVYYNGFLKFPKSACSNCAGLKTREISKKRRVQKQFNKVVELFKNSDCKLLSIIDDFDTVKTTTIEYECPKHGKQKSRLDVIKKGNVCKYCSYDKLRDKRQLDTNNIKEVALSKNSLWLNAHEYINSNYKNMHIKCLDCGYEYTTTFACLKKSDCACPQCSLKNKSVAKTMSPDLVEKVINSKNNNVLLNKNEYIGSAISNLKVCCGTCGNIFTTALSGYKDKKYICPKCISDDIKQRSKLSQDSVKNEINSINNNILLNKEEYLNITSVNLKIKCGHCNNIFITSLASYRRGKIMCDSCSSKESKHERIIREFLEENNISFEQQKRFDDCRDNQPLPFDFYLPNFNTIIEYDGEGHYLEKFYSSRFDNPIGALKHTQYHDEIKNNYCKENNINLLRIPYWEGANIKEIIKEKLKL